MLFLFLKEQIKSIPSFSIPILSKVILSLAGFTNLILSINLLSPNDFTKLAIIQTVIFVLVTIFDTGFTQNSLYKISNSSVWKKNSIACQGVRLLIYLAMIIFFLAFVTIQKNFTFLLLIASISAVFSNIFNVDWILIGLQDKKNLALKNIVFGISSVLLTFIFIRISNKAESVLFATTFATVIAYTFFCKVKRFPFFIWFSSPKKIDLRSTIKLSVANTSAHLSYNLPILLMGYFGQSNMSNVFSCLYRLFSSSILLVSPVIEFQVASELSKKIKPSQFNPATIFNIFLKFSFTSLLLCLPFLVLPNQLLFKLFLKVIDLEKYHINVLNFNYLKIIIFLFCLEYSLIKSLFVFKMKSIISISSLIGMLFSIGYTLFFYGSGTNLSILFTIIYIYQSITLVVGLIYLSVYGK
jgi:O-antigen/teichoic acid export membrane protein